MTRREVLTLAAGVAAGGALNRYLSPERGRAAVGEASAAPASDLEYVWLSANAHLPLFVAHDHPALDLAAKELGVRVTIAGPDDVNIPGLVAAVEQTAARKPAGLMVVGWDPAALIPAINTAMDSGVPVVCVDADVPGSRRLAFIGTDWYDLGQRQGEAMVAALAGKKGKVALLGLIEQAIDVAAFKGFREVVEKAGCTCLEPFQDKGNQAEAARVAAGVLQAHPDLVGMAGFDSESGPGMGQAIKEAGKTGTLVATCVEAEQQHLRLLKAGILTACVGQKRELFTNLGVKVLHEYNRSPVRFTGNDRAAGVSPVAVNYNTGTYTVTRATVDLFLKG